MSRKRHGSRALGAVIAYFRLLRGWSQTRLARMTGISKGAISEYERGNKQPEPETLARLAKALRVPVVLFPVFESLSRAVLSLMAFADHAKKIGDLTEEAAAVAARGAESFVRAVLVTMGPELRSLSKPALPSPALPHPEDRQIAPGLWAVLEPLSLDQQRACIAELPEYQSWALAELLGELSATVAADDAGRAVELAELALWVASHLSGDPAWRSRLQARCLEYLGNARRVRGDLATAEEAFSHARQLWPAEEPDDLGLLRKVRSFDLEASLRLEQGRFAEALYLLDRALELTEESWAVADLRIKKASTLELSGDHSGALALLDDAASQIDRQSAPRHYFALRFNHATTLCRLDRHAEAEPVLPEIRALAMELGKKLDLVRTRWLEGRVAAGLGRVEEALAALEEVRAALAARGIDFDTAQVSLELAALYLEGGKKARVRELAKAAAAVFERQDNRREAEAAFQLLRAAA